MNDTGPRVPRGALSRDVTVVNQRGLHARAAARFARLAETFDAETAVSASGLTVSGLSIMGLMMLGAGPGADLTIFAWGAQAAAALDALCALVEQGFDET